MDTTIKTLGELKQSGYQPKTIKEELRSNLIKMLHNKQETFPGVYGYEHTVVPDLERAILSMHNILLLGLRGQAKTRMARQMTNLLDEYVPVVEGSSLNDDPLAPISSSAKEIIQKMGDDTPIRWWHRSERFVEKLATPDTNIADLIGDIDPIKAANKKITLSDEQAIHYGLVPRSNRAIFVINELPDLQARIQVALFNILQEGDIQIRGFNLRIPLDIQFVFTANPEDYTNRGSIVTPLKDRIQSQILTHYPMDINVGMAITKQEARIPQASAKNIECHHILYELIEEIAIQARNSEFVDQKSGVSARLTIAALENLYASAERRMLLSNEEKTFIRIGDIYGVLQAITGKVELVYEGEQEGSGAVAYTLISKAVRELYVRYFPNPELSKKSKATNPYLSIVEWFNKGNTITLNTDLNDKAYAQAINKVEGLEELCHQLVVGVKSKQEKLLWQELVLHGLSEYSLISKKIERGHTTFSDLLSGLMSSSINDMADDDDY